ncbi:MULTISPECIES: hypothetical protein [Thermomonospora]|jgi:hypothetical protein|uniref:Uncharacterized protein n=1 Tax=Thermomonospora curvata (strain ATCC 19995 / DSM 43183 / JCM 3096 / KCTC 9072 / NBRC 15933 / NCIMB 10081 / Henssen B9) TaxID=471852 RepID=D1A9K5_THECD|nr:MULTISPECIES: hypothetical protein [Thermomonospora]ACY98691.1 hypothetical protein Tcur_3150 [Thermomonospora curvata DSM 43183]PKK13900.1 MAG: hypothetical protein BUE48_015350 [Thermomonospora sp. CIF 1]
MGRHRRGQPREITVGELVAALQQFDPKLRVRLAVQPRLPQEHRIGPVAEADGLVWIGEAGHCGYAPDEAAESLGWR